MYTDRECQELDSTRIYFPYGYPHRRNLVASAMSAAGKRAGRDDNGSLKSLMNSRDFETRQDLVLDGQDATSSEGAIHDQASTI